MGDKTQTGELVSRLAICAVAATALVYALEKLCAGKGFPLWEKYGPWLVENKIQAIAIVAAVLYGASLALLPQKGTAEPFGPPPEGDGFEACT